MGYAKGSYEHRILTFLARNERSSMAELFPVVRIDTSRVRDIVRDLVRKGEVEEYKPGHFRLGPKAPRLDEAPDEALDDRILAALAEKGRATRNVLSSATGRPAAALTGILKGLSDRGLIELDGSAWVLTKRGAAKVPAKEAPPAEEAPATRARGRKRIAPAPAPSTPTQAPTLPAPGPTAPAPEPRMPITSPPPALVRDKWVAPPRAAAPAPAATRPLARPAAPAPLPSATQWDEGFAFEGVPRKPSVRVDRDGLDLSEVPEAEDAWVELRWDPRSRALAIIAMPERSRQAVRLEGGRVTTPHAGQLLGTGVFPAAWNASERRVVVQAV